jgi:integrase
MLALAIQDGDAAVNPVRDSRLVELFRCSDRAAETDLPDLPDLVDWMLATGCRIGEALALRYGINGDGRPILDLDAGPGR